MFQDLLETIATTLEEHRFPYMVIGGQAVLIYGEPRLTRDIDITLGSGIERLKDLLSLAETAGWTVLVEHPESFVSETMVLPCQEPSSGIRIDFIFSFSEYERQAIARSNMVRIGTANVRYVSVEDLIVHKLIAGRPRDVEDVRVVLIKQQGVDASYVRQWLRQFEDVLEQPLVSQFDDLLRQTG